MSARPSAESAARKLLVSWGLWHEHSLPCAPLWTGHRPFNLIVGDDQTSVLRRSAAAYAKASLLALSFDSEAQVRTMTGQCLIGEDCIAGVECHCGGPGAASGSLPTWGQASGVLGTVPRLWQRSLSGGGAAAAAAAAATGITDSGLQG